MTKSYIFAINPGLTITPKFLPVAGVDLPYSVDFGGLFGQMPYKFTQPFGSLPPGTSFNDNGDGTATLSGTPTAGGTFEFTVRLRDVTKKAVERTFTLQVIALPMQITGSLMDATIGTPYLDTLTIIGGDAPYTLGATSLPAGLSASVLGSTITVSGTPTGPAGAFSASIVVNDSGVQTVPFAQGMTVNLAPVVVTGTPPDGDVGTPYSFTFTATGGLGAPFAWTIASGALPTGITLNPTTGNISGTPTTAQTAAFTVRATDTGGNFGNNAQSVDIILPTPVIATLFSTTLYTGNAAGTRNIAGIDLSAGGVSWFKSRSAAQAHGTYYSPNGSGVHVAAFEGGGTEATDGTTFTGAGTSLGAATQNVSARTYVNWAMRRGLRFVDVIRYTGNGANRSLPHGLAVAPALVMIKQVTPVGGSTYFQHVNLGASLAIAMTASASVAGAAFWNSTLADASNIYLGTNSNVNSSGQDYIAIVFAHDLATDGVVRGFTYVGNGLAAGPSVTLGWQPQFLFAIGDGASPRQVYDTTRSPGFTGNDAMLQLNTTAAELSLSDVALITGGFQINRAAANINVSGRTYYGLAIRA